METLVLTESQSGLRHFVSNAIEVETQLLRTIVGIVAMSIISLCKVFSHLEGATGSNKGYVVPNAKLQSN